MENIEHSRLKKEEQAQSKLKKERKGKDLLIDWREILLRTDYNEMMMCKDGGHLNEVFDFPSFFLSLPLSRFLGSTKKDSVLKTYCFDERDRDRERERKNGIK